MDSLTRFYTQVERQATTGFQKRLEGMGSTAHKSRAICFGILPCKGRVICTEEYLNAAALSFPITLKQGGNL